MFIDEARRLINARVTARGELQEAWELVRIGFLTGRLPGLDMTRTRIARRGADADPGLFELVQDAALSGLDDEGLDQQIHALYHELAASQGCAEPRARQDHLLTLVEEGWLSPRLDARGRTVELIDLERVLRDSHLEEERRPAWEALSRPPRKAAADALEWLRLEHECALASGYSSLVDEQGQLLRLDKLEPSAWLELLHRDLGPVIRRAAEDSLPGWAEGLGRRSGTPAGATPCGLYPAGAANLSEHVDPAVLRHLSDRDPLDLLNDSADLLGLEIAAPMSRWLTRVHTLPAGLAGLVEGPEGRWPIVLLNLQAGWRGCVQALDAMGRCLAYQARAVLAAQAGADCCVPFPLRGLLARAFGGFLGVLPHTSDWALRLLDCHDAEGWTDGWRRRELLHLGEDLVRLEWLVRAPLLDHRAAGELWLELRHRWLAVPAADGALDEWATDPWLSLRPREVVGNVAARMLCASLRAEWGIGPSSSLDPDLGGRLLDELTEPMQPESWGEALEHVRARLVPGALVAEANPDPA